MEWLRKIINPKVEWYEKYAYIRLAQSRGSHHWQLVQMIYQHIPEIIFGAGLISYNNIKDWLNKFPIWIYIVLACLYVIVPFFLQIFIGHIDLQNRLYERDQKLANQYNPDLQEILKNSRRKDGKGKRLFSKEESVQRFS